MRSSVRRILPLFVCPALLSACKPDDRQAARHTARQLPPQAPAPSPVAFDQLKSIIEAYASGRTGRSKARLAPPRPRRDVATAENTPPFLREPWHVTAS
jgi:hypothetical protein